MSYSEEQKFFIIGKRVLDDISQRTACNSGSISYEDYRTRDEVLTALLAAITPYAQQMAFSMTEKYRLSSDAHADLFQNICCKFFERLDNYEPTHTTPTTYFTPFFKEVISSYVQNYSQNLKQNDANNLGKINKCKRKYSNRGINNISIDLISSETGLSHKVVKNTLYLANNSQYANIDDALNVASKMKTPEEMLLDKEKSVEIIKAIKDELSEEELEFFLTKVNLDGNKDLTYTELAERYGMTIRDAKTKYSKILSRLNNNKVLNSYNKNAKEEITELCLHDKDATDIMEDMISDSLFGSDEDTKN